MDEAVDYAADGRPGRASAERAEELIARAVVTLGPLVVMSNLLLLAYCLHQ